MTNIMAESTNNEFERMSVTKRHQNCRRAIKTTRRKMNGTYIKHDQLKTMFQNEKTSKNHVSF